MIRTNENRVKHALNAPCSVSCGMGGITNHGTRGGRGGAFPCVLRGVKLSTKMLISSSTYEATKSFIDVIKISDVEIRGKSHKMNIYEVLKVIE